MKLQLLPYIPLIEHFYDIMIIKVYLAKYYICTLWHNTGFYHHNEKLNSRSAQHTTVTPCDVRPFQSHKFCGLNDKDQLH